MNTPQPADERHQANAQAISDKAKMLVDLSGQLGLPQGNNGDPELNAAIASERAARAALAPDTFHFELQAPDGQRWTIYLDGHCEGFRSGTVVRNHAVLSTDRLMGEMRDKVVGDAGQYLKAATWYWLVA